MQEEIWKDVVGYEGMYQVSNLGNVKSLSRIVKYQENHSGLRKERILKQNLTKSGYVHVVICINKLNKTVKVHRLVALAFIQNTENKHSVNHINGIKYDNRVENLEWVTHSENIIHAYKTGLKKGIRGNKSHLSKLTIKEVEKIRLIHSEGKISQKKIGEMFNISQAQVYRIIKKINWVANV
jgi:hypothetical protein